MRANHAVTLGLCFGLVGIAGWVAGCGTDTFGTCTDTNTCGGGDGGGDVVTGDVTVVDDAGEGSAPFDGGDSSVAKDGGSEGASDARAEGEAGCAAPLSLDCNGTCVDPTRPEHCGTCTNVCAGPDSGTGQATCTSGVCGLGCTGATSLDCNGACVDPSQPATCGTCTNACAGPTSGTGSAVCTLGADGGGACSVTCGGSTTLMCGTNCYAPTDPNHCGGCSNACSGPTNGNGTATCTGSTPTCGIACSSGYHVCSGACDSNGDVPSNTGDPCIVSEAYGVFVSPGGSDGNAGTQLMPVRTLGTAMDLAKAAGKRVYACGNNGTYDENLVVGSSRDGVGVYGGLDCTSVPSQWTYVAADVAVVAPTAQGYALAVTGLTAGVTFEDFGFTAQAGSLAGDSSIGVFAASSSNVLLRRCSVTAGAGMPGQDQSQPAPYSAAAPLGNPGGRPRVPEVRAPADRSNLTPLVPQAGEGQGARP